MNLCLCRRCPRTAQKVLTCRAAVAFMCSKGHVTWVWISR